MKKYTFVKAACVGFILAVLYSVIPFQSGCSRLSRDVVRLHILAESDSPRDQELKLRVRDKVLETAAPLLRDTGSKAEALAALSENISRLTSAAEKELAAGGCTLPVKAEITNMYFDTRYYRDFTMPSGKYDALRLTIGSGRGHNWWCVMYPSLCLTAPEAQQSQAKEELDEGEYRVLSEEHTQYRFKIVEVFEKIRSCFS